MKSIESQRMNRLAYELDHISPNCSLNFFKNAYNIKK
jgi:hypothetical protein